VGGGWRWRGLSGKRLSISPTIRVLWGGWRVLRRVGGFWTGDGDGGGGGGGGGRGCETLAETWQGSSSAWMVGAVCVWLSSLLVAVMR